MQTTPEQAGGAAPSEGCPFHGAEPIRFPQQRGCPMDPPPGYGEIQQSGHLAKVRLWNDQVAWLVTRYEDVRAILNDPRVSADSTRPGFPGANAGMDLMRKKYLTFISMDPPQHTAQRRMLTSEFTVRRVESMRPRIQEIVDGLIDRMLEENTQPVDLIDKLLHPVPSAVICDMLGVPISDLDYFYGLAKRIASSKTSAEDALKTSIELCDGYLGELIDKKNGDLQDDLLSRLIESQVRTGALSRHELISLARMLLVAGLETTGNTLALGLVAFFQHPEQWEMLKADPARVPGAVEEVLRYVDVSHMGRRRSATEDFEFAGESIRAGDGLIAMNILANRDPSMFNDPDRFDITRDARKHVAFGFGVHQCQGQPLARAEMQIVYSTLARRMPNLRLAVPLEQLPFNADMFVYGLDALPVTW